MALDHKGLMYQVLNKYVSNHSLPYYKGQDLMVELESDAWEGFFQACLRWDEAKGTLSTFAYPSIKNALNARMKVLERMGSSMVGHQVEGKIFSRPALSSLEQLDERRHPEDGIYGFYNSLSDLLPNAMDHSEVEPSMEDAVVERIDQEEKMKAIRAVVEKMDEPYKDIFTLIYLEKPTHDIAKSAESRLIGGGWTIREVAKKYRRDTGWVKEILDEAVDYVRYQMGVGRPETSPNKEVLEEDD